MSLVFLFYLLFPIALIISIIVSIVILINAILKNDTKKIKKMAIVIALLLTPIAYHYAKIAFYNSNSIPDINPHPTLKMRVYGDYPLEKDVGLKAIGVEYVNKNPKCNKDKWLLDEIGIPLFRTKTFPVTVKNGKFESIVYLDSYLPGICQWEAYHIMAHMESKKKNIVFFPIVEKITKDTRTKIIPSTKKEQLGTIAYNAFSEQSKKIYIDCTKEKAKIFKTNKDDYIIIDCHDTFIKDSGDHSAGVGLGDTPNISIIQKEVQVNFLDKGWREQ